MSLKVKNKLKLVLVDHNILNSCDCDLDSSVIEIIDHHQLEHPPSDKITMVVEPVGSCCTLVSSLILEQAPNFLKADSATLLMGNTIIYYIFPKNLLFTIFFILDPWKALKNALYQMKISKESESPKIFKNYWQSV